MTELSEPHYSQFINICIKWYIEKINEGKENPFKIKIRDIPNSELRALDIYYHTNRFFKRLLVLLHLDDFKKPEIELIEKIYDSLCNLGNPLNGPYTKGLLYIKLHNDTPISFDDTILNFDSCYPDSATPKVKKPRSLL